MKERVYSLLKRVPMGKVTTYKQLAEAVNTHPRVIGMLMKNNKDPVNIPCYKVVKSDGSLGGYSGRDGIKTKILLLQKDGIIVKNNKIGLSSYLHSFSKS